EDAAVAGQQSGSGCTRRIAEYADAGTARATPGRVRVWSWWRRCGGRTATSATGSSADCRTALVRKVVRGRQDRLILHARNTERFGVAGPAAIVEENLHRRHAAAGREVEPHDAAIGERQLARVDPCDGLNAGRGAELEGGVNRASRVRRPVPHLAG